MRSRPLPCFATLALSAPLLALLLVLAAGVPGAPGARAQGAAQGPLPEGPGVELVYAKCQQCHPLRYVTESAGLPPFLWQDTLDLMQQLGMQVTAEEEEILYSYFTTYLGLTPPPQPSGAATDSAADTADTTTEAEPAADVDGAALYAANCASCHGAGGDGIAGVFPPLVGHAPALFAAERDYLPQLLLYGLQGEITVQGERYQGVMPAWAQLSDAELAAVLNHLLTSWGNDAALPADAAPYEATEVAGQRGLGLNGAAMVERRPPVRD